MYLPVGRGLQVGIYFGLLWILPNFRLSPVVLNCHGPDLLGSVFAT